MPLGEARLGRTGLDGSRFGRAGEHSPARRNSGIAQYRLFVERVAKGPNRPFAAPQDRSVKRAVEWK